MSNIEVIDYSDNKLSGNIIPELGELNNLVYLDLSENEFRGKLPKEIAEIDTLEVIRVTDNYLVGDVENEYKTKQANGNIVHLNNNYMSGNVIGSMESNSITNNFVDVSFSGNSSIEQYDMRANNTYYYIGKNNRINIYEIFNNVNTRTGNKIEKEKLRPDEYILEVIGSGAALVNINSDANGIYIEPLEEISYDDRINFELRIKENTVDSKYSKVSFDFGTEKKVINPGGGGNTNPPSTIDNEVYEHKSYIKGYKDNTVRPDDNMSREEVTTVIYRIIDDEQKDNVSAEKRFDDVSLTKWSNKYITYCYDKEIVNGYPDGTFKPEQGITRAEFAKLFYEYAGLSGSGENIFTDITGHWAEKYITEVYEEGFIIGYPDGSYRPNEEITRAEIIAIINRYEGRNPSSNSIENAENNYNDLNNNHWAYKHIIEATNDHKFTWEDGYENWE